MFNNKGKDILVWINCVVFIIVIGLSTFKGTLKEGLFGGGDKKDDKKGGGLFGGGKASGETEEAGDPEIPDSCKTDKQKEDAKAIYEHYRRENSTYTSSNNDNWKEKNDNVNFAKEKEIYKILNKIYKKKKYKDVMNKNLYSNFKYYNIIDKKSQENLAHMVCDGKVKNFPYKNYGYKKRKKDKCEYLGKGVWNSEEENCECVSGAGLMGEDKDRNPQYIIKGKKKKENEKYDQDNNVKCYCAKDSKGRTYNWDIDESVCKLDKKYEEEEE